MQRCKHHLNGNHSLRLCAVIAAALTLLLLLALSAQAQSFQVLHTFTGGADGYYPTSVVTDGAGTLYGGASYGGNYESSCNYVGTPTGCGVVFKMSHHGSSWIFDPLASFDGANGYNPLQGITVAPNGTLYSTTFYGGPGGPECHYFGPGCGTVVQLQPPANFCQAFSCPWTVTDIHQFVGGPSDGQFPELGSLTMDAAGNLYGSTLSGGEYGDGMVYEMSPTGSGWTMSVLYNFGWAVTWGVGPEGGVVFDKFGNLYGVTVQGGEYGCGAVYRLSPSSSGWNITPLHSFNSQTDGQSPLGTPVMDASGNIYGTTLSYGPNGSGTVWELSPNHGSLNASVIYAFSGGEGPDGGLLRDSAGNLYGATESGGAGRYGVVFELSPVNGGWNYTVLHSFTGGSDGGFPASNLSMDSAGNLYGVAGSGGQTGPNCVSGCGVVFEITP